MRIRQTILLTLIAAALVLAACGKSEEATNADKKMAEDIAKIREIKEKEQAEKVEGEADLKKFKDEVKKGSAAPIKSY
jgi:hypothetical protein